LDVQRQYNLRNRNAIINSNKYLIGQPLATQKKKDAPKKDMPKVVDPKEYDSKGFQEGKDVNTREIEKIQPSFSLENEISKIKIYVPFNELLKNTGYKRHIIKILKTKEETSDTLNLQDDHPSFLFDP
jgi:hypothetical protein